MRLINADDMINRIEGNDRNDMASLLREWIDAQPTVDAIPVEWLYDKRFRSVYVLGQQNPTLEVGINIVLNEWRKEQEVR